MSQPERSEGPVGCPGTWSTRGEREGGAEETGEGRKDEKTKGEDECRGPPSSPVIGKEKIVLFLQILKPRTRDVTEQSTWSPRGCSCRYFRWRMGTTLEWLSRRRRSSWPPFTPSWKASALESSRIPLSWDMQPPRPQCVQLTTADVQTGWGGGTKTSAHGRGYLQRLYCVMWHPPEELRETHEGKNKGNDVLRASSLFLWQVEQTCLFPGPQTFPTFLLLRFLPYRASQAQYI